MKLLQKLALSYYQTKLKVLQTISVEKAGEAAFELFCTPYSRRRTYTEPAIFATAEKLSFEFENHAIKGFRWKPAAPNGNKILICHGFDSYSYRFEEFIAPLLKDGFEVLAFDAPAHGLSSGKTINALLYSEMIIRVNDLYGPVNGIMAHSFGGLAAGLAIEKMQSKDMKQFILIAPATETTRSITDFCRHLKLDQKMRSQLEQIIVQMGGNAPSWYSVARVVREIRIPVLWLHDEQDSITPYQDMQHLQQLHLSNLTFIITQGLGHSLYRDSKVANEILTCFRKMVYAPKPLPTT